MSWRLCLAVSIGLAPGLAWPNPDAPAPSADAEVTYVQLKAPLFGEQFASFPVAKVDDEVITLRELTDALATTHGAHGGDAKAGKKDFTPVLDRLIDVRLLILEAREMGIDELPEFKDARDEFKTSLGQEILKARVTKDVKADPADVDQLYKDAVREWKVRSVLFVKEAAAKDFVKQVKAGKKLEDLAKTAVADKKAKGGDVADWLPRARMLPQVLGTLQKLKAGETAAPVVVPDGWAVMKVDEIRYPTDVDQKAMSEAQSIARARAQKAALQKYYDGLVKRYATIDRKLLKSLDFEAEKPGLAALAKDGRVIAKIQGEKPITVADFTASLAQGFFHGADNAKKEKKINREKDNVFDAVLAARVVPMQVRRDGIPDTADFKARLSAWEGKYLFTKFIEQAVIPTLKMDEAAARKYYGEHRKEFTYPAFYKLESLAFSSVKDAQAAVDKLRSGTDFKWLNANADGQIKPAERKDHIEGTLAANTLPKELSEALAGAKKGDCRLFAGAQSQFYAVHVVDVIPEAEQPFDQAREAIGQRLFGEELTKAIKTWADKARTARDVKVYITRIGG